MRNTEPLHFRTWIELSRANLKRNYRVFRKLLNTRTKLLAVIKSNAYGHGLVHVGKSLAEHGVDWIGVDSISEALRLRKEKISKPILVLGYTLPGNFKLAHGHGISLAISSYENLEALGKFRKKLHIHLKFDTGMHRQGFAAGEAHKVLAILKKLRNVHVEGVFTHFASAKDKSDPQDTRRQIELFKNVIEKFRDSGYDPIRHAAATGGAINFPESHFDMVRIGIGLYGYWPSNETKEQFQDTINLSPVLTWKTVISELKWVEKGERIGYDYTETIAQRTRVAVLPIGYWHGYWRAFSSKSHVLVKGKRCKILGRVSMDMVAVDVTEVSAPRVGSEVVLIGKQGNGFISADELGGLAGTSCYEVLTRLNPLIKKYYR